MSLILDLSFQTATRAQFVTKVPNSKRTDSERALFPRANYHNWNESLGGFEMAHPTPLPPFRESVFPLAARLLRELCDGVLQNRHSGYPQDSQSSSFEQELGTANPEKPLTSDHPEASRRPRWTQTIEQMRHLCGEASTQLALADQDLSAMGTHAGLLSAEVGDAMDHLASATAREAAEWDDAQSILRAPPASRSSTAASRADAFLRRFFCRHEEEECTAIDEEEKDDTSAAGGGQGGTGTSYRKKTSYFESPPVPAPYQVDDETGQLFPAPRWPALDLYLANLTLHTLVGDRKPTLSGDSGGAPRHSSGDKKTGEGNHPGFSHHARRIAEKAQEAASDIWYARILVERALQYLETWVQGQSRILHGSCGEEGRKEEDEEENEAKPGRRKGESETGGHKRLCTELAGLQRQVDYLRGLDVDYYMKRARRRAIAVGKLAAYLDQVRASVRTDLELMLDAGMSVKVRHHESYQEVTAKSTTLLYSFPQDVAGLAEDLSRLKVSFDEKTRQAGNVAAALESRVSDPRYYWHEEDIESGIFWWADSLRDPLRPGGDHYDGLRACGLPEDQYDSVLSRDPVAIYRDSVLGDFMLDDEQPRDVLMKWYI